MRETPDVLRPGTGRPSQEAIERGCAEAAALLAQWEERRTTTREVIWQTVIVPVSGYASATTLPLGMQTIGGRGIPLPSRNTGRSLTQLLGSMDISRRQREEVVAYAAGLMQTHRAAVVARMQEQVCPRSAELTTGADMYSALLALESFSIDEKDRLLADSWDTLGLALTAKLTNYAMKAARPVLRPTADYWTPKQIADVLELNCS